MLFAVVRTRGAAWRTDRLPQEQEAFEPHVAVVNRLYEAGIIPLGGWLGEAGDVLLIMRAGSAAEIRRLLDEDPWTTLDILPVTRVEPWTLGLGALPASPASS